MGIAQPKKKLTIEEYLEVEIQSQLRHEFHDGGIYAMAGGTIEHGDIGSNVHVFLKNSFRASKNTCRAFHSDHKLYVKAKNKFVYPDAFATCSKIEKSEKGNAVCNPILIIEVLSESTAEYDRGDKFHLYRQLPSLKEYVLIDQKKLMVEVYFKPTGSDLWKITRYEAPEDSIVFESLNLKMSMKKVYEDVFEM